MTEIEQKALALVNEVEADLQLSEQTTHLGDGKMAICLRRAIEQHEAFKREVSDAVEDYCGYVPPDCPSHPITRFILPQPKPDPLVEALEAALWDVSNVKLTDSELFQTRLSP